MPDFQAKRCKMSKLIIEKDRDTYWLHIKSDNIRYSAMINLASAVRFPESIVMKAIEEAIKDQAKVKGK